MLENGWHRLYHGSGGDPSRATESAVSVMGNATASGRVTSPWWHRQPAVWAKLMVATGKEADSVAQLEWLQAVASAVAEHAAR